MFLLQDDIYIIYTVYIYHEDVCALQSVWMTIANNIKGMSDTLTHGL